MVKWVGGRDLGGQVVRWIGSWWFGFNFRVLWFRYSR